MQQVKRNYGHCNCLVDGMNILQGVTEHLEKSEAISDSFHFQAIPGITTAFSQGLYIEKYLVIGINALCIQKHLQLAAHTCKRSNGHENLQHWLCTWCDEFQLHWS